MTFVEGRYFPATVRFPDRTEWRRTLVILARGDEGDVNAGLHVWQQPTEDAQCRAGIDWERTKIPQPHQARNGFSVYTDQGLFVITASSGCRCGLLARFSGPGWANTVRAVAR